MKKTLFLILNLITGIILFSCSSDSIKENELETNTEYELPGLNNTGPTTTNLLVDSDAITVDAKWANGGSGTEEDPFIVENLNISGSLKIKTSNVIVRNFIVNVNTLYPVQTNYEGVSNILIEDGEIIGGTNSSATMIVKNGVTIKRLNLHETGGDGIKVQGSDFWMESCWVYNIGSAEGSHADGVQGTVNGEGNRWKNHTYLGNFFDMAVNKLTGDYSSNATIFLHVNDEGAGIDNILIKNNWLIGGNWCLPIGEGMADLIIKDNKFGHKDVEVRYGNLLISSPSETSGSVYYDTGEPITD